MSLEVMLDLETMSTRTDAVVISIGAVKMDTTNGAVVEKFYRVLPVLEQEVAGRHISASTMLWWLKQSDDARQVFSEKPESMVIQALDAFTDFMKGASAIWGNGADFDVAILGSLYETFGLRRPWSHRQVRCFRTLKNLIPLSYTLPFIGTEHNALDDAEYQAEWLYTLLRTMEPHNA